jgi:hypothetical protein
MRDLLKRRRMRIKYVPHQRWELPGERHSRLERRTSAENYDCVRDTNLVEGVSKWTRVRHCLIVCRFESGRPVRSPVTPRLRDVGAWRELAKTGGTTQCRRPAAWRTHVGHALGQFWEMRLNGNVGHLSARHHREAAACCPIRLFLASMSSMLSRRYSLYVSPSLGTDGVLKSSNGMKNLTAEQSVTRSCSMKNSTYPRKSSNNAKKSRYLPSVSPRGLRWPR